MTKFIVKHVGIYDTYYHEFDGLNEVESFVKIMLDEGAKQEDLTVWSVKEAAVTVNDKEKRKQKKEQRFVN